MVVALLVAIATGAPMVECDPDRADQIMTEARIQEDRISSSHPYLIPGLALASTDIDTDLRKQLEQICASDLDLSYDLAEAWDSALFSAHTVLFTTTREQDCTLHQSTIAVTVGNVPGQSPQYALRGRLPRTTTPVGDCDALGTWREETVIAGGETPERLVLVVDRAGLEITASRIVIRSASPKGWREQVLAEPAPKRYTGGHGGMAFTLIPVEDSYWVVSSHDRTDDPAACEARPGQVIWRRTSEHWSSIDGREALSVLADRGLWRHAGEDGWLLILTQDDPFQIDDVVARMRRMQRRNPQPLQILDSADFPNLTAGYVLVTPAPFRNEEAALAMRTAWGRRAAAYVKRAWTAPDPCAAPERHP